MSAIFINELQQQELTYCRDQITSQMKSLQHALTYLCHEQTIANAAPLSIDIESIKVTIRNRHKELVKAKAVVVSKINANQANIELAISAQNFFNNIRYLL